MSSRPLSISFHVGAHKTATSHLQRCLKNAADALAADGVRYCGPSYFRSAGDTIPARFGFGKASHNKADPIAQLDALRQGADRLVLSEENFIGVLYSINGVAVRRRYAPAGDRLSAFASAIGHEVDVFLGVRRPTAYINSAYSQMLLGGHVMPLGVFLRRNPISSVDWFDVVSRIRAAKGVGRVIVWRYEDYASLFSRIVSGLVGADNAHHVGMLDQSINTGLSAAAVAEILHRSVQGSFDKFGFTARKMLPVRHGYPAFDGYTVDEHARGDAAYASQIAAINNIDGVTLLRP